jgi:serine/threonine protein phosphatase 1
MSSPVLILEENTKGRDFVVGDIHGHFEVLDKALAAVNFDPEKDRLISIGDLINRGPQSPRCLEFLAQPWFHAVRGNHEDFFIKNFEKGLNYTPEQKAAVRDDFRWLFNQSAQDLKRMRQAFMEMPIAVEMKTARGTVGFVHCDVPEGMDWNTFKKNIEAGDPATTQTAVESRERLDAKSLSGVDGIDRIFFGHIPQRHGMAHLGNCYYVDTGCFYCFRGKVEDFSLTLADVTARTSSMDVPRQDGYFRTITQGTPATHPFTTYKNVKGHSRMASGKGISG